MITYAGDVLQSSLPESLRARIEELVFLETEEVRYRHVYPDVHIVEHRTSDKSDAQTPQDSVSIAEPVVIKLKNEPVTQRYIEIVDAASGNRVITVIEFLSPSNKLPGEGEGLYLQKKQQEVINAGASLVEIDLTRIGRRIFALSPDHIPPEHRTTYQICVRRGSYRYGAEIYRAPLSERLPVIGIPLRPTDKDIPLDLQALIDQCYKNGRYDDIDYKAQLDPPLDEADAAWTDQRLKDKGVR